MFKGISKVKYKCEEKKMNKTKIKHGETTSEPRHALEMTHRVMYPVRLRNRQIRSHT